MTLTFDRADKKNAITDTMYGTLADEIAGAEGDPDTLVILLRAEGDTFTAGNDLADFRQSETENVDSPEKNVRRFLHALTTASKPIVAAVQGKAVGVGATLLLHCDHVVLAEGAALVTPFVGLGLVPEAASSLLLPARIGHVRAFSMFALGEPVPAESALAWGLANSVVPVAELDSAAYAIAARLAAQPAGAVAATKRLMRSPEALQTRIDEESARFYERLKTAEAQEAFAAFGERRPADFKKFR
ncbi:enoyl-CoA hydratase-related protein [Antricoccus suffuscus]|uniref:enoyl-CoA hydratase-related protein n=1 Tax=Antricoccus suffuscus TaxID=1629062 RepID=UPI00192DF427|nr:enoyl-CoA hydratase-related protein [Antricoccus suffuscus]